MIYLTLKLRILTLFLGSEYNIQNLIVKLIQPLRLFSIYNYCVMLKNYLR